MPRQTTQHDFTGRVAVVTGGAQGIGLAAARRLAGSGARVAIWDLDEPEMARARDALGGDTLAVRCDQARWEDVEAAAKATEAAFGRVDILVNNAGIAGPAAPLAAYDLAAWRQVIDIDLHGVFHCCRAVVPGMVARNYGRIVNVSSVAGKEGNPNAAAYSAAKAGVLALTKSLGKELAAYDIAVNALTPSPAKTRILDQLTPEQVSYMLGKVPRGRFVEVDEAAAMIAFMASDENSFTTGATFDLSGGRTTY
ncbi:SDR family NAD(P)-dependent oxidoreductase [Chthonobacter rhizosphaerae]|uniref:SDR family NAD(P)-dependent oxidoreductase n=1 Tax=Chthonobacter rhizosphaerae TaxID=2735553 RepID=UPI0015EFAE0A|nr:SDR family NAD(P)-dependent oxidoreductase [Chthonobacter rhizosphaerae]